MKFAKILRTSFSTKHLRVTASDAYEPSFWTLLNGSNSQKKFTVEIWRDPKYAFALQVKWFITEPFRFWVVCLNLILYTEAVVQRCSIKT